MSQGTRCIYCRLAIAVRFIEEPDLAGGGGFVQQVIIWEMRDPRVPILQGVAELYPPARRILPGGMREN
jgi:hypothetical protein